MADKLHQYTSLPVDYVLKASLRVIGSMFEQQLQIASDIATGRLDSRFSGPAIDPLEKSSDYDPQSLSISSACVTASTITCVRS